MQIALWHTSVKAISALFQLMMRWQDEDKLAYWPELLWLTLETRNALPETCITLHNMQLLYWKVWKMPNTDCEWSCCFTELLKHFVDWYNCLVKGCVCPLTLLSEITDIQECKSIQGGCYCPTLAVLYEAINCVIVRQHWSLIHSGAECDEGL